MNDHGPKENTTVASDRATGVRIAFDSVPTLGGPIEVASGIFWIRLPLQASLDHVNVYALDDAEGWTLIDTGSNTAECRAALDAVFQNGSLSHRPITRVISTHYHPDHIGLAGVLVEKGAILYSSRVCWLYAKMLQLDDRKLPCDEQVRFMIKAGLKGMDLEAYKRREPSNYSQQVASLPYSFRRLRQDEQLNIGTRRWTVHIGHGHAAHHVTLWSQDGIAISGDQILSGTSSNLSVHPSEPDADLVSEWLDSCHRFMNLADEQTLCLPGHNLPFRGIPSRCEQLIASQQVVLNRLLDSLDRPKTAMECLETVYRRTLESNERGTLISETVGFLNHLRLRGLVQREPIAGAAYVWRRTPQRPLQRTGSSVINQEPIIRQENERIGVSAIAEVPSFHPTQNTQQTTASLSLENSGNVGRPIATIGPSEGAEADLDFRSIKFFIRSVLFLLVACGGYLTGEQMPQAKQIIVERIQALFQYLNLPTDQQNRNSDHRDSPKASVCKPHNIACDWSMVLPCYGKCGG